jgi:hypothetical protein
MMDDNKFGAVFGMSGNIIDVLAEILPHFRCVHHKSHMTWAGLELGLLRWEAAEQPPEL